jgi:hypothetical protein
MCRKETQGTLCSHAKKKPEVKKVKFSWSPADEHDRTIVTKCLLVIPWQEISMNGKTGKDTVFKATILAFLMLSILMQILVSAWFFDKLTGLENRLSLYPVDKPVDVDLRVTIPELVEIDRKIERLAQLLSQALTNGGETLTAQQKTSTKGSSKAVTKKATPRASTQVDVVEKIGN